MSRQPSQELLEGWLLLEEVREKGRAKVGGKRGEGGESGRGAQGRREEGGDAGHVRLRR